MMNQQTATWARDEFADAELGDRRRVARLQTIAVAVATAPAGTISSCIVDPAEREAAFRYVENDDISAEAMLAASARKTAERCQGQKQLFVVGDQTTISLNDRYQLKGLGPTASRRSANRGLEVMSGLAVTSDGVVQGLLGQEWFVRSDEDKPLWRVDTRESFDRETALWIRLVLTANAHLREHASDVRPCFVFDRGADAYGVLRSAVQMNVDILVRSAHNRILEDGQRLHDVSRRSPVVATINRVIRSTGDKGVHKDRKARLIIRAIGVRIRLQTSKQAPRGIVDMSIVHVRERRRSKPIEWFLLTTLSTSSRKKVLGVVNGYCLRWRVEDFHRAWKSGHCNVESCQLRSVGAIQRWGTILAVVAARAEELKTLSRTTPDVPAIERLSRDELDTLIVMSCTKKHKIGDALTLGQAVALLASIGGWGGPSAGQPGTVRIGRGLQRVESAAVVVGALRK